MTDTDEAKTSAFDHFEDSQDLIYTPQEQSNVHEHVAARSSCLGSAQKDSVCEKPSQESYISGRSSKYFTYLTTTVPTNALLDDSGSEIDLSDSTSSLIQHECNITPAARSSTRHLANSPANTLDRDTSSDSSLDPGSPFKLAKSPGLSRSALNLKASFDYHLRRKYRRQAHQRCKEKPKERKKRYKSTGKPRGRPRLTAPQEEQKKRLLDRGFQFSFVEKEYGKKHIPMKMIFEYEQAALKGYFQYIKMLKYEEHLKKALKNLNASEDLENECMAMRKHKYIDDEGPISPIEETDGDDHNLDPDQEELGATIVA
ncbi:TATA box-binding protein-associated factor RNA polymerase I subunit D isoform X2 [Malaclemys terrapin pileata]|uniref:TATA box-binding protein-associated factor RNA polymerase I subunit D isoform X2 n=1 Tax=Malaclemys terrapin pileata TaxID=2991368 RepID=UPI0023A87E94|nr:TATA box-binding protein-associated factor RNA polymerase I subunit D isoform X2 [Malaclemys terrapin pileata]XP_053871638.1 TATA box-binding protein-associated factor RNA polymerase I subunit D isoform X2 [Malaclemys terrapin pileata]